METYEGRLTGGQEVVPTARVAAAEGEVAEVAEVAEILHCMSLSKSGCLGWDPTGTV